MTKQQQRNHANHARVIQPNKDELSQIICDRFITLANQQSAETIMWYLHCRSEVRTINSLKQPLKQSKTIVVPYCTTDEQGNNTLGLWRLTDLSELVSGTWGILEPPKSQWYHPARHISPQSLDLIMVPGVAFDRDGGRLGHGAGYYDRLLQQVRKDTYLAGVCFESQLCDHIVMEDHDVYMNAVLTEKQGYFQIT